jgi:hypothetical protein
MSSSQASTPILHAVSGTPEDQAPGIAAKQQDARQVQRPGGGPEPAFGCVDWYLYPQELREAAG